MNTNIDEAYEKYLKLSEIDKITFLKQCIEELPKSSKINNTNKYENYTENNEFIKILVEYSKYILQYPLEYHTSVYTYNKKYRDEKNYEIEEINEFQKNIKNILDVINTITISDKINNMTNTNTIIASFGELIIDCYMYYDFQTCFNSYYSNQDYSLYECVKKIFYNELFNWNNCNFIHTKYTNDYIEFSNLFYRKSLLYIPVNHISYFKEIFYDNTSYVLRNDYIENNIFIKKMCKIDISYCKNFIKKYSSQKKNKINNIYIDIKTNKKEDIDIKDYTCCEDCEECLKSDDISYQNILYELNIIDGDDEKKINVYKKITYIIDRHNKVYNFLL